METCGRDIGTARDAGLAARFAGAEAARRRRRTSAAMLGLALGVLLGLLYAPRSRWIVAEQARRSVSVRASAIPATAADILTMPLGGARKKAVSATAARPEDAEMQTALRALDLREQMEAGPLTPAKAMDAFVPLLDKFPSTPEVHAAALRHTAITMASHGAAPGIRDQVMRRFLRVADQGQALEPENAFFPAMRAAALTTSGRDAEARAALSAAARCKDWNDHVAFETRGAWRIADAACGMGNPVARAAMTWRIEVSPYPRLRRAADIATGRAFDAERAGRLEEGYAIRRDLLTLGEHMRIRSTTLQGALAGIRIQQTAALGATGSTLSPAGRKPDAERDFPAYLRRAGHADEAPWAARQWAAHTAVLRVAETGLGRLDFAERLNRFSAWFAFGQTLLSGALWTMLLVVLAHITGRRARNSAPRSRRSWERAQAVLTLGLAAALALSAAVLLAGPPQEHGAAIGRLTPAIIFAVAALSSVRARRADALVRSFLTVALPVACALILLYGGVTLQTLRMAAGVNRGLTAMVEHEGRFYAGLAGVPWPK